MRHQYITSCGVWLQAALAAALSGYACAPALAAEPAGFRPMQITIRASVQSTAAGFRQFGTSALIGGGSCGATCCGPDGLGGTICASASAPMPSGYYPGPCVNLNAICSAAAASVSGGGVTCTCGCHISCSETGGPTGNLSGNGITAGAGGLANDFGTTRLAGPDQGQPTFTPHTSRANGEWMKEKEKQNRRHAARAVLNRRASENCRAPSGNIRYFMSPCQAASLQKKAGLERAYSWLSRKLPGGMTTEVQSPVGSLRLGPTPATTADYESRYLNAIPDGEGQPIGGAGITQGPPDKLPPPSPTGPELDRGGGDVRCPKDHPYYNDKSGNCYVAADQCGKDTSRGKASCQDKTAPLSPVNPPPAPPARQQAQEPGTVPTAPGEPAVKLRGELKCRKAWWLNTGDENCYADEAACKAASPGSAGGAPAATPLCSQTNP